jgi:hypothetical protein
MLIYPKTTLNFDNSWLDKLKFQEHTDYHLKGGCSAIAIKSESGSVYDFYRSNPIEQPSDFKLTQLYYKVHEVKRIIDYFSFIETTRVRIHKSDPGNVIDLHTDDNNILVKDKDDFRLRIITALNSDEDFIYTYEFEGNRQDIKLLQGQSIIFDPDKVKHGLINSSRNKTRYALVQVFKAYPVHRGLIDFINTDQLWKI